MIKLKLIFIYFLFSHEILLIDCFKQLHVNKRLVQLPKVSYVSSKQTRLDNTIQPEINTLQATASKEKLYSLLLQPISFTLNLLETCSIGLYRIIYNIFFPPKLKKKLQSIYLQIPMIKYLWPKHNGNRDIL